MKKLPVFLAFFLAISFSVSAQDKQTDKKETVKVYGNCEMCQSRIEKAAKGAGASSAKWDVDSKVLTVSFNPAKGSLAKIEKSVAGSGYDTEHETSTKEAYDKLPECCQYDRKATTTEVKSN
ncbi:MAG: heavy-metal-associated protein [Segetibacter sp.]|nr:heavy-metal-associated protein [Segetibacter sp.]